MKCGFLLYGDRHGKKDVGSSRIRGEQLIKYWPEAEKFKYAVKYNVLIFQKLYVNRYYLDQELINHHNHAIKILDICDPDWFTSSNNDYNYVVETIKNVDGITCPTKAIKKYLSRITDKPIMVIPDRMDLEFYKEKKLHRFKAKMVAWFGYAHNDHCLKAQIISSDGKEKGPLKEILKKNNLKLMVISDKQSGNTNTLADRWVKWDLLKFNETLIQADFVIMPASTDPKWMFKSTNKAITSWALNLPVAYSLDEIKKFIDPKAREKEAKKRLKLVKDKYDVKLSVKNMQEFICQLKKKKN